MLIFFELQKYLYIEIYIKLWKRLDFARNMDIHYIAKNRLVDGDVENVVLKQFKEGE